jgi:hypothetical protein
MKAKSTSPKNSDTSGPVPYYEICLLSLGPPAAEETTETDPAQSLAHPCLAAPADHRDFSIPAASAVIG